MHRDKTRVQMPAKIFPHLKLMLAVYGPHSWFCHKAKKHFLDKILMFFYNNNKILTILFTVKYEKITIFD